MPLPQQNLRQHETDLPQNKLNSWQNKLFLKLGMAIRNEGTRNGESLKIETSFVVILINKLKCTLHYITNHLYSKPF